MLAPNQLIKLIESKDKALYEKDSALYEKDSAIHEKDKIIAEQDALWTATKARERRYQGKEGREFAHKLEICHIIMPTPEHLHAFTGYQIDDFYWLLKYFREFILDYLDKMPLFDIKSGKRVSDAGNRCKLDPEHALLVGLMKKRTNVTQGQLAALFGIDQTTVCRYIKLVDEILKQILPTAKNMSDIIQSDEKPIQQIQKVLGNTLLIDGTHVPVRRSEDSVQRNKSYSGKKKRFTFNTEIITNSKGIIIHQTKSYLGSNHDFSIFKKESESILNVIKLLTGSSKTKLYSDKGFLGISDYLDNNTQSMQPKKRSKNRQLTKRERVKNRKMNGIRTRVEHTIGDMKTYARMVDAYDGTLEEFETEFSVVTGLVNLRTMWKKIRSRWKKGEPPPPWTVYFD